MKSVLIGGGSGFIGTTLRSLLEKKGYNVIVVSRNAGANRITWDDVKNTGIPAGTEAVINLAGQNVLDPTKRWNESFKQKVRESRIDTTLSFANAIEKSSHKPKAFISISGVGIYKPSLQKEYDENSELDGRFDFISSLAHDWENANKLSTSEVRQIIIRSGVVLGRSGGMISQIFLQFYFGLGGPIGNGSQYFPWIHLHDLCRLFQFSIENNNVNGVLNGVAPQIITNKEFTEAFTKALHRPSLIPLPSFVVKALFGSERATMMLEGQKVIPRRVTEEYGFQYLYPNIDKACAEFSKLFYKEQSIE